MELWLCKVEDFARNQTGGYENHVNSNHELWNYEKFCKFENVE